MCSLVFMATGSLLHMKRFSCAKFRRYINRELTTAAEINVCPGMAWGDSIDWALIIDRLGPCILPSRLGFPPSVSAPGSDPESSRKVPLALPQDPFLPGIQGGGICSAVCSRDVGHYCRCHSIVLKYVPTIVNGESIPLPLKPFL